MRNRTIVSNVKPQIEGGRFFVKRVLGEYLEVTADIFGDGHDAVRAHLLYKHEQDKKWTEVRMQPGENDIWSAEFQLNKRGVYLYKVQSWIDHLLNWRQGFLKKEADGQNMQVELQIGAAFLEEASQAQPKTKAARLKKTAKSWTDEGKYKESVAFVIGSEMDQIIEDFPLRRFVTENNPELKVRVGRQKELFSSWYELFPRSTAEEKGKHGTFKDTERLLPRIAALGFDVLYIPPIHPIGKVNRKGKNNNEKATVGEPGSPWAIGSEEGGHKAVHPELGTLKDFKHLLAEAKKHDIEIAMDIAFQAAPDHPWIKEHPEWFIWRPDGTIAYAENPPKKYQDIVPINFESNDWKHLWEELKSIFIYWCEQGVRIFRVDNPHTKAFRFWEWCINGVLQEYPDTIFLAEAFTRPKVMAELAKRGFTQSYSYFTWRTDPQEMKMYLTELSQPGLRDVMRPNFWPNTPDILAYELMGAGANQFVKRLLLAGTLSSNYGLYGPAYEFMENTGADTGKEEYHNAEKYEIRHYDWSAHNRLTDAMSALNTIRKEQPALQDTFNIHFTKTNNEHLLSYIKLTHDHSNIIWCVVNFDPHHTQSGLVEVPQEILDIDGDIRLQLTDLLTGETYRWTYDWNYVSLDPHKWPAHIMKVELL